LGNRRLRGHLWPDGLRRHDLRRRGRGREVERYLDPAGDRLAVAHRRNERPLSGRDDRGRVEIGPARFDHVDHGDVPIRVDRHREDDVGVLALGERRRRIDRIDVLHHDRGVTAALALSFACTPAPASKTAVAAAQANGACSLRCDAWRRWHIREVNSAVVEAKK
jgi:hypothetical protein